MESSVPFSSFDINFYATLIFVLFNVLISLFFINKYMLLSRKYKRLSNQASNKKNLIIEFLNDQHNNTTAHKRVPGGAQLDKEIILLRKAYLKIESQALARYQADNNKYLRFLNDHLIRLLKILLPQYYQRKQQDNSLLDKVNRVKSKFNELESKAKLPKSKFKNFSSTLDSLAHTTPSSKADKERLEEKLDKINSIITIYEDDNLRKRYVASKKKLEYANSGKASVNKMKKASDRANTSIEHFDESKIKDDIESELNRFRSENKQLKENLQSLQEQFEKIGSSNSSIIAGITNQKEDSIDDLSEEILEANEREIDRLRGVINSQRNSIFEMEDTIQKLDKSSAESDQSEIDKLRRCITESEVCIQILENELDELKHHLDEIKSQKGLGSEAEKEELASEVEDLRKDLQESIDQSNQNQSLVEAFKELLNAKSIEDISLLIYEEVSKLNYSPSVVIYTPERNFELAKKGQVTIREKVIINNMQPGEFNPSTRGALTFKLLHLGGILTPEGELPDHTANLEYLSSLLKFTDKVIKFLIEQSKIRKIDANISDCINTIKHTSYEIDKQLEKNNKNLKTSLESTFKQIKEYGRSTGLSATQISKFQSMENELLNQIKADDIVRLKTKKQLLALIGKLEK